MKSKRQQRESDDLWNKILAVLFLMMVVWFAWKQTQPQPTLQDYQREVNQYMIQQQGSYSGNLEYLDLP